MEDLEDCSFLICFLVSVPPDPPALSVVSADAESLHLKWVDKVQRDIPILGTSFANKSFLRSV